MKHFVIACSLLLVTLDSHSQTLIPLKIDSLYTWSWSRGFDPEFDTVESYTAYSYDANDSLIQTRQPEMRTSYTYANDTLVKLNEVLDINQIWTFFSRVTVVYKNDIVIEELIEIFKNDAWENSSRRTYYFNAGKETLQLLDHWKNDAWVDFYKKESTYNANGDKIEEAEFYTDQNGLFEYNNGYLYSFDNAHRLIERTHVNTSINGPYFTSTETWVYGNADLLNTYERCHYVGQTCRNVTMVVYEYPAQHTIVGNGYRWENNAWNYHGQTLTFSSPPVYSHEPDSIVYYEYRIEEQVHVPKIRRLLSYTDLGNQNIYFKDVTFTFFEDVQEWQRTALKEEWYHIQRSVGINETMDPETHATIYPNPCSSGQSIRLQIDSESEDIQVLIFDIEGRLASSQMGNNSAFIAPRQSGLYTAVFRTQHQLLKTMKLIVAE